ncbi:hypothetical protein Rcae01_00319 [Novipirellula caenicola]|uniref:Uncharacterized protein n=1 Tax=Novipirellula caenicola TaxID=1536901 RepID=A0ABP9VJW9_9BACT
MKTLNKVCFAICMICILFAVVTSISMIWTPGIDELKWRLLATDGVVFLGSVSTMTVAKAYGGRQMD